MANLVLSLFPGIGLLDMAFEEQGFCVVRGPDQLWGGDIKRFHLPVGRFDGIIGGPPCQAHSKFADINRKMGHKIAIDLIPEFVRCIQEAQPEWWLMENVPNVPTIEVDGYTVMRFACNPRWLGEKQSRLRHFQFGSVRGATISIDEYGLNHPEWESTCMASEGRAGMSKNSRKNGEQCSIYVPRREWSKFCELQGLSKSFLEKAPFTVEGKYRVVGNGVPLPMGRAIAKAVLRAISVQNAVAI